MTAGAGNHRAELDRIRAEYYRRASDERLRARYSALNPAQRFTLEQRDRALWRFLRSEGLESLAGLRVLDVGCGDGDQLRRFLKFGADVPLLHGLELLGERLQAAGAGQPNLNYVQGDGARLPYPDRSFDVATQYMVFSSILDTMFRQQVAREMWRVLKPGGLVVSYDFWLNPANSATCGIGSAEIARLFPAGRQRSRRVTLAPPIARLLVPRSRRLAEALEALCPALRSHYFFLVKKGF